MESDVCKEYPAEINLAEQQCIGLAMNYHGYIVGTKCRGSSSFEFNINFDLKNMKASIGQTMDPGATCSAESTLYRDTFTQACKTSATAYRGALAKVCADVP